VTVDRRGTEERGKEVEWTHHRAGSWPRAVVELGAARGESVVEPRNEAMRTHHLGWVMVQVSGRTEERGYEAERLEGAVA